MKYKPSFTLLAASPTKEGILKSINEYFYTTSIELKPLSGVKDFYDVYNSKGKIFDFIVIFNGGRFRFFRKN